jgi:hypothetical protein
VRGVIVGDSVGLERGDCSPRIVSPDQGSSKAVTLADLIDADEPQIPLARGIVAGGAQDAITLQVHHQGVDGALVAAGIQTQFADQIGAGMGTALDQGGSDGGAEDGADHRILHGAGSLPA